MHQKVGGIYTRYKNRGWGRNKGITILSIPRKFVGTVIQVRIKEVLALQTVGKTVVALTENFVDAKSSQRLTFMENTHVKGL